MVNVGIKGSFLCPWGYLNRQRPLLELLYRKDYRPCAGEVLAVNAIGTQVHDPIHLV